MKTDATIVLTIFGGERCVTTLEDLEAGAHAIHSKAVCEYQTRANPSTLGAEIEWQIRLINAGIGLPKRRLQPDDNSIAAAVPGAAVQRGRLDLAQPSEACAMPNRS
jgi:hypothetical protein